MRYRPLGRWGLKVSEVALGAWTTYGDSVRDLGQIRAITKIAYEAGVNFFDNADVYAGGKAEEVMGEVLSDYPRDTLVLSSKAYWPMSDDVNDRGLSRKHLMASIEHSLRRLRIDYLDLYFAHRHDDQTPMDEIVSTFSNLVDQGKILYWGTSEWPAAKIAEAVAFADQHGFHPPAVEQPQYSMLWSERVEQEILPITDEYGLGVVVWSPLAMGMLTGKYDDGMPEGARLTSNDGFRERILTDENRNRVIELKKVADDLGVTRAQLALAWVLRSASITSAITGATNPEQIEESLGGVGLDIPSDALAQLDGILS